MLLEVYCCRRRAAMLGGTALLALVTALPPASAQDQPSPPAPSVQTPSTPAPTPSPQISGGGTKLPQINVRGARRPAPRPVARRVAPPSTVPPVSPTEVIAGKNNSFDQARSNLYTTIGTTSDTKNHETDRGDCRRGRTRRSSACCNKRPVCRRILLRAVCFTCATIKLPMRSIASTAFFCRMASAVSASILDADLSRSFARYWCAAGGIRTALTDIIDLTTRTDIFSNSDSINYYFGSRERIQPSFEYVGTPSAPTARTPARQCRQKRQRRHRQDCFGGVLNISSLAVICRPTKIENPTPFLNPVHDMAAGEGVRVFIDLPRSVYAFKPHCRHL